MIKIKTEKIKAIASKVMLGVDDNRLSPVSELLELELMDGNLLFKTTNKEYFLSTIVKDVASTNESLKATIQATDFLNLISKINTEEISLELQDGGLVLTSSGKYTFPLILDGDVPASLPVIEFNKEDITERFTVESDKLRSILDFNSKELQNQAVTKSYHKYYYWDKEVALTFVEGACINEIKTSTNAKMLLSQRLVSLFKLFDAGLNVQVFITKTESGKDYNGNAMYQNKIKFLTGNIELISILPDDEMLNEFPSRPVIELGEKERAGCVTIPKQDLMEALNRLLIFESSNNGDTKRCGEFLFEDDGLIIVGLETGNLEHISYKEKNQFVPYKCYISLSYLLKHINLPIADDIKIEYNGADSIVFKRSNYKQVIPEVGMEDDEVEG